MKLLESILENVERRGMYDYFYNYTNIENTDVAVLAVSVLHHNKIINDAKMQAMFSSLRKGTFLRHLNTHHSNINDKWYSDTNMFTVLMDIYINAHKPNTMTLDVFLGYLNKYHNKNKNFCLDVVYFNYILPLLNNVETYQCYRILKNFEVIDGFALRYEDADNLHDLGSGHCCEDCDGPYEDYKRSRYEYYYKKNMMDAAKEKAKAFLYAMKTHHKNPNEKLKPGV